MAVTTSSNSAGPTGAGVETAAPAQSGVAPDGTQVLRVNWDDSKISTSFANVVNVLSTREEVTLLFGTNQTWNIPETGALTVQLTNRIVLSPYAAKRLMMLLTARVKDYESRFGTLNL